MFTLQRRVEQMNKIYKVQLTETAILMTTQRHYTKYILKDDVFNKWDRHTRKIPSAPNRSRTDDLPNTCFEYISEIYFITSLINLLMSSYLSSLNTFGIKYTRSGFNGPVVGLRAARVHVPARVMCSFTVPLSLYPCNQTKCSGWRGWG